MEDKTRSTLRRALHHAEAYLSGLDGQPVAATVSVNELRERLDVKLGDKGTDSEQVIDQLVAATAGGILGCAGGRFFGWVIGGALPSALAADWLVSTWDQNAALYACSPAAAVVEEVAGGWLKDLLGLPKEASFAFTTGSQLAHFTALAAARYAVLSNVGWDVNEAGLYGAPRIHILVNEHRHASVDRALRYLGFGTRDIVALATDAEGCVTPHALESALSQSKLPTVVVLDAADLNIAAFDAFETLIPIAKSAGAWVHIDGAFGLFARASHSKRRLVAGVEAADSWVTDGHKWLNVPFDCGLVFVRNSVAHQAAMSISAAYIAPEGRGRDQIDWNPEWSRRGRGIAVYAALRELGRSGLEDLVDRTCGYATELVSRIGELPHVEVLWRARLNQGLIRFLDPRANATDVEHDTRTDAVINAINRTGEAFFSGTTWRGRRAMRVSVVNWRTNKVDVERTVTAVTCVLRDLSC